MRLFGVFPEQVVEAQAFIPFLAKGLDKRGIKKEFSSTSFFEDHTPFAKMFRVFGGVCGEHDDDFFVAVVEVAESGVVHWSTAWLTTS